MSDLDVIREAAGGLYTPEGVAIWMEAPNRLLDNRTPAEMVEAGHADRVLALIEAIAGGACA